MKKIFLFSILFPILSASQNYSGVVIDNKSNLPIEDVKINVIRFNENYSTNKEGKFDIKKFSQLQDNDSLSFSHISYILKKISFNELKKNNYLIMLEEKTEVLDNVIISSSTTKEQKTKITYQKLASQKKALSNFGAVVKNNKIFIIGGDASYKTDAWKKLQYEKIDPTMEDYIRELNFQNSSDVYNGNLMIYDINTNQWETSQLKFRKRAYHNLNEYDDKIYILGGKKISVNGVYEYLDNTIEVFDINKQTITIDNTNPHQAADFASFTYNASLIVMGGSIKKNDNGVKIYTDKVHLYDLTSGFWYQLESMPIAKETSGVVIQNKIFLFGGFNGRPLSTVESFDLITEKWKTEGNLSTPLSNPAISSKEDMVYLFENEKIYTYNIYSKELKEYLINLPLKASKMFLLDDKLYILGGYIENYYSKYPSPNLFSIEMDEFKNTKPNKITIIQSQ